jgi:hypothetical protein
MADKKLILLNAKEVKEKYHEAARLLFMVMHTVGNFSALGFNRKAIEDFCKQYKKDNNHGKITQSMG